MYKSILLIILISYNLWACSMCAVFTPKVEVHTTIHAKPNSTTFDIRWQFHPEFNKALTVYDVNSNKKYERAERDAIKQSIEEYIIPVNYLLNVEYITKNEEFNRDFIEKYTVNFSRLTFTKEGAMVYEYNIDAPIILKEDFKLYVEHFDAGGNFDFVMKDIILKGYDKFKMIQPELTNSKVYFYKTDIITSPAPRKLPKVLAPQNYETEVETKKDIKDLQEENGILEYLSKSLENVKDLLENNLQNIKDTNSIKSYFWLLVFSLLYGIIHALGPGHGKTLISSYFLGNNRSYMKALSISSMIGVVHTFSAFILTLIVYFVIGTLLTSFIIEVEKVAIKVSAGIIILIALFLLFQKLKNLKKNKQQFSIAQQTPSFIKTSKVQQPVHQNTLSCGCNACKTKSTDIGVILAAGIVPCPGTVTVFIFTMSLGIYFVGFLSAVFMSLGMSLVIFITALLSAKLRKSTSSNTFIVKFLEYGSIIFILLLGIILLII